MRGIQLLVDAIKRQEDSLREVKDHINGLDKEIKAAKPGAWRSTAKAENEEKPGSKAGTA